MEIAESLQAADLSRVGHNKKPAICGKIDSWGYVAVSLWVPRGVSAEQPEEDDWDDVVPVLAEGSISSNEVELTLSDSELQREKRLRREALRRKRPPGFAAWPEG